MYRAHLRLWQILGVALLIALSATSCRKPAKPEGTTTTNPPKPPVEVAEDPNVSLRLNPPVLTAVEVTPLDDTGQGALLTATFKEDPRLKDSLELMVADQPVTLSRAKEPANTFTGKIPFDWSAMSKELAQAARQARESKPAPIFNLRTQVGTRERADLQQFDPALFERARAAKKPFKIPLDILDWLWIFVDPARELMVTDLSVVEDPARTFDPCTGAGTPGGAWTFGKLMTDMANTSATGVDPSDFVRHWLESWLSDQTLNTFTVPQRQSIQAILDHWPKLANGKLDLNKAPFRLLAIVNRLDLRTNNAYGGGDAGEGRFVFGLVNQGTDGTCPASSQSQFTVILEYGVPISGCLAVHNYASKWMALGDIALGNAAFNPALQTVTDIFTAAGAGGSKPNGSAINQVRTNEVALGSPWDLREFRVDPGTHQLGIVMPVKQPHKGLMNQAVIDQIITDNETAILNGTFPFPDLFPGTTPFRGGQAENTLAAWRGAANDPVHSNARHQFSLDTCNACHGGETNDQFLHITNRAQGATAGLSLFLLGDGTLSSPSTHAFPDPFTGTTRSMGDLQRRRVQLAKLNGSCKAIGLFGELQFKPLLMSH